jgi:plasmid stabilization system protein ParE
VAASHEVRLTANFVANLESIHDYLKEHEAESGFDLLLDWLFDSLVSNLEEFPRIGRDFLAREPASEEGAAKRELLKRRTGRDREIREYVSADYLVLYAVERSSVFLLAIRHHRQLSFDLRDHWS